MPKLCPRCSATCPNTWRAEPRKKNTLSFFKRNSTPAKSEMQGVFFFRGCRGSARQWRNDSFLIRIASKKVRILYNEYRQLGNEIIGSPAPTSLKLRRASTRARQPFFGEISSRFEFSKAKSGLFFSEIKRYIRANYSM